MTQRPDDQRSGLASAVPSPPTGFQQPPLVYRGPKDVGRAESLYRSALTKPDLDYCLHLLFSSLAANPEHEGALHAILDKGAAVAARGRKANLISGIPASSSEAEGFLRSLVQYCRVQELEPLIAVITEAHKAALAAQVGVLGQHALLQLEGAKGAPKPVLLMRLLDAMEACGHLEQAVAVVGIGRRLFPEDQAFRVREKNLLASQYLQDTRLEQTDSFRASLRDPERQAAMHKPKDQEARLEELVQQYQHTRRLDDFQELRRALREFSSERRESALPILQEGFERFGEKATLWLIREIKLERRWAEVRLHQQTLAEHPQDPQLQREHQKLRREVLAEHIDHLYEVVSSLPSTPERHRRELELAGKLLEAGRHEEAIKQAQAVRRHGDSRLEAWMVMAKAFVQLGLTPEAGECFQSILKELGESGQTSVEGVLEAKYSYAQFLLQEAKAKQSAVLAQQTRKLCSDVMIEDIDYRNVRELAAQADQLMHNSEPSAATSP